MTLRIRSVAMTRRMSWLGRSDAGLGALHPRARAVVGHMSLGIEIAGVEMPDMVEERLRGLAALDLVLGERTLQ